MMQIYCLRNKLVGAYEIPTYNEADKDSMTFQFRKAIILDPNKAKEMHLNECELYYLGSFDQLSGTFYLLEKPEFLMDCGDEYARRTKED